MFSYTYLGILFENMSHTKSEIDVVLSIIINVTFSVQFLHPLKIRSTLLGQQRSYTKKKIRWLMFFLAILVQLGITSTCFMSKVESKWPSKFNHPGPLKIRPVHSTTF